jgi:hypothetical protein
MHHFSLAYIPLTVLSISDINTVFFWTRFRHSSSDDHFVVHRGRGVPTLSSVVQAEEPLLPARLRPAKEKQNQDSKAEERGEPIAAGRPSNWEDSRRSSYAGRRSRRNSLSEDSQVSLVLNWWLWMVILRSSYRIPYSIRIMYLYCKTACKV